MVLDETFVAGVVREVLFGTELERHLCYSGCGGESPRVLDLRHHSRHDVDVYQRQT